MFSRRQEHEEPRNSIPTLRDLGVNFYENTLRLLDAPMEIRWRDVGGCREFVGAPSGLVLNKYDLHSLLRTLKTHPESQEMQGAVADWKNPQFEQSHESMTRHGEWKTVRRGLGSFIEVAEDKPVDEWLIRQMTNDHWHVPIRRYLLMGFLNVNDSGRFASHELSSRQLGNAVEVYATTAEGHHVISHYKKGLRKRGLLKNDNDLTQGAIDDPYQIERDHQSAIPENTPTVIAFLKYLGNTPLERYWRLLQIAADTSCWGYPVDGYRFDPNKPDELEIYLKRMKLLEDGIYITTDYTPARILEITDDPILSDESQRLLYPIIRFRNGSPVKTLVPVWAWRRTADGKRDWLYDDPYSRLRASFPKRRISSHELPNSLAGYLHLSYALPQLRRFPKELPFHRGSKPQEMQEGQIPYLAMFYHHTFVNSPLVEQLEDLALPA